MDARRMDLVMTPELVRSTLTRMKYVNVSDDVVRSILKSSRSQLEQLQQQRYGRSEHRDECATDQYYGTSDSDSETDDTSYCGSSEDGSSSTAADDEDSYGGRQHHAGHSVTEDDGETTDAADQTRRDEPLYLTAAGVPSPRRAKPVEAPQMTQSPRQSLSVRTRSVRGGVQNLRMSAGTASPRRSAPSPAWDSRHCHAHLLTPSGRQRTATGLMPGPHHSHFSQTMPAPMPQPVAHRDPTRGVIFGGAPHAGSRSRVNDPVQRHKRMQQLWRNDRFLSQEGRASLRWQVRCRMLD
eukprot:TRINITY_DN769_c1_g3_i11.p1 TRINITY_DN769_c1_g3~~TRINITY_DN769_c1_g3_i11.p1  ORF type:complete len:296 (+),score=51.71 TRINITY_DN769_c1_g3_i11:408-1295(+)